MAESFSRDGALERGRRPRRPRRGYARGAQALLGRRPRLQRRPLGIGRILDGPEPQEGGAAGRFAFDVALVVGDQVRSRRPRSAVGASGETLLRHEALGVPPGVPRARAWPLRSAGRDVARHTQPYLGLRDRGPSRGRRTARGGKGTSTSQACASRRSPAPPSSTLPSGCTFWSAASRPRRERTMASSSSARYSSPSASIAFAISTTRPRRERPGGQARLELRLGADRELAAPPALRPRPLRHGARPPRPRRSVAAHDRHRRPAMDQRRSSLGDVRPHATRPSDGSEYGLLWWVFEDLGGYVASGASFSLCAVLPREGIVAAVARNHTGATRASFDYKAEKRRVIELSSRFVTD